jgi:hypothetical protein
MSASPEIEVPRDRAGSFDPAIVKKWQRRSADVDTIVLSLYAKGLTTGEHRPLRGDLRRLGVQGHHQPDHRQGRCRDGRVVGTAAEEGAASIGRCESLPKGFQMPHWAWNKASPEVKRRYFELIRAGWISQAASVEGACHPAAGRCGSSMLVGDA